MAAARRPRTARREGERAQKKLIADRERLWKLEPGGSAGRPITVESAAVIEPRATSMPCPQCGGRLLFGDHRAPGGGLRAVDVRCAQCHVIRTIWFRLGSFAPS